MIVAAAAALLAAPGATAAVKNGTYVEGKPKGFNTLHSYVKLRVKDNRFSVVRISYPDVCKNSQGPYDNEFSFVEGSSASISGRVRANGRFKGVYKAAAGKVVVKGKIKGDTATITGKERSMYTPKGASEVATCSGKHTFVATRR